MSIKNGSSLRVIEQDLTPEKRPCNMTIALTHEEKNYIERDLFIAMRRLVTPSTIGCYLMRDSIARVRQGETTIQHLCEKHCQSPLSEGEYTLTGVIITGNTMAAIQLIQNMRGNFRMREASQQEILDEIVKAGVRSIKAKQGQFIDEAAEDETHAAPVEDVSELSGNSADSG